MTKAQDKRPPASNVGTPVFDMIQWRHYIGRDGPLDRTTRYVLLVIGIFMDVTTGACWPSIKKIAKAALLSERAVAKHVRKAIEEGFLIRQRRRGSNYYRAAFPTHDREPPIISISAHIERYVVPGDDEQGDRAMEAVARLRQRSRGNGE